MCPIDFFVDDLPVYHQFFFAQWCELTGEIFEEGKVSRAVQCQQPLDELTPEFPRQGPHIKAVP